MARLAGLRSYLLGTLVAIALTLLVLAQSPTIPFFNYVPGSPSPAAVHTAAAPAAQIEASAPTSTSSPVTALSSLPTATRTIAPATATKSALRPVAASTSVLVAPASTRTPSAATATSTAVSPSLTPPAPTAPIASTPDGKVETPASGSTVGGPISGPGSGSTLTPTHRFDTYWGTVTVGGAAAPVGTRVEAFSPRGDLVGSHTVTTAGYFGYMRVYGEDATGNPVIPGMRVGEAVIFKVNGITQTTTPSAVSWQNDPTPREIGLSTGRTP